jgi:V8-like Glu-specific endopeptidase
MGLSSLRLAFLLQLHPSDRRGPLRSVFYLLSLILLVSCQKDTELSSQTEDPGNRGILFGTVISKTEFPSVGLVKGPNWICSGTLIAPDIVLTANHCVVNDNGSLATLRFTLDAKYSSTNNWVNVSSIRNYKTADLALIKLATPVISASSTSELALTAITQSQVNQIAEIVGYGDSQTTTNSSGKAEDSGAGTKRKGQLRFSGFNDNNATLVSKPSTSRQIICPGDSGGPLFFNQNGRKQVAGVASTVLWRGTCVTVSESRHGHVGYQTNRNWILQNLAYWAKRRDVFRGVNPSGNYFFTFSTAEAGSTYNFGTPARPAFRILDVPGKFSNGDCSVNLIRCRNSRGRNYLSASSCGQDTFEALLGYACLGNKTSQSPTGAFDLYRVDNASTGASISTSQTEANSIVQRDRNWRIIGFHGVHVLPGTP